MCKQELSNQDLANPDALRDGGEVVAAGNNRTAHVIAHGISV
jgi:hypothetical protein